MRVALLRRTRASAVPNRFGRCSIAIRLAECVTGSTFRQRAGRSAARTRPDDRRSRTI